MATSKITASIFRSLSGEIIEALANIGVNSMLVETARSPVVEEGGFFVISVKNGELILEHRFYYFKDFTFISSSILKIKYWSTIFYFY